MTDKRLIAPLLLLAPLALLAACRDEPADEGAGAAGEVLEGTISDEMLPLDRVRSQPPLEDPEAFEEVRREGAERAAQRAPDAAGGEAPAGDDEAAEPAPAAQPAPAAED